MKRIWKKILIFVLIFSISFSFLDNRKTAYATIGDPTVVSLEFILMMLLGYVANQNDINLPLPNNQSDKYDMFKIAFSLNNLTRLDAIDKNDLYNVNTGKSMLQYIADGGDMSNMDFSEWVTYQEHMEIKSEDLEIVEDGLKEYYDVPILSNKIDTSYNGMVASLKSSLQEFNINISSDLLIDTGIFDYKYITVITDNLNIQTSSAKNYVIGTNIEPKISQIYHSTTTPASLYDILWIPTVEEHLRFELKFNQSTLWGIAGLTSGLFNNKYLNVSKSYPSEPISERLIFSNYDIKGETPTFSAGSYRSWRNGNLGITLNSSLGYRTFLASKYGGGALGLKENEEIDVKLGVIGRVIRHVPELLLDIDNVGSTDVALENLKNIDDFAQENYGERAISPTITDVKPIAYPVEYTEILEITDSIDDNFNNSLGAINFDTTDFPDYLLVGLSFVAWVFGQLWLSMGDYSIVFVFVASISLVAVLFGLGLKRDKTGSKSDSSSKSTKSKKK